MAGSLDEDDLQLYELYLKKRENIEIENKFNPDRDLLIPEHLTYDMYDDDKACAKFRALEDRFHVWIAAILHVGIGKSLKLTWHKGTGRIRISGKSQFIMKWIKKKFDICRNFADKLTKKIRVSELGTLFLKVQSTYEVRTTFSPELALPIAENIKHIVGERGAKFRAAENRFHAWIAAIEYTETENELQFLINLKTGTIKVIGDSNDIKQWCKETFNTCLATVNELTTEIEQFELCDYYWYARSEYQLEDGFLPDSDLPLPEHINYDEGAEYATFRVVIERFHAWIAVKEYTKTDEDLTFTYDTERGTIIVCTKESLNIKRWCEKKFRIYCEKVDELTEIIKRSKYIELYSKANETYLVHNFNPDTDLPAAEQIKYKSAKCVKFRVTKNRFHAWVAAMSFIVVEADVEREYDTKSGTITITRGSGDIQQWLNKYFNRCLNTVEEIIDENNQFVLYKLYLEAIDEYEVDTDFIPQKDLPIAEQVRFDRGANCAKFRVDKHRYHAWIAAIKDKEGETDADFRYNNRSGTITISGDSDDIKEWIENEHKFCLDAVNKLTTKMNKLVGDFFPRTIGLNAFIQMRLNTSII